MEAGPAGHALPELLVDHDQHGHEVLVGGGARQPRSKVRPQVVLQVLADLQQLDPAQHVNRWQQESGEQPSGTGSDVHECSKCSG